MIARCKCGASYLVIGTSVEITTKGCPYCGQNGASGDSWPYQSAVSEKVVRFEASTKPNDDGKVSFMVDWVEPDYGRQRGQAFFAVPGEHLERWRKEGWKIEYIGELSARFAR